jgi:hypothetical protein
MTITTELSRLGKLRAWFWLKLVKSECNFCTRRAMAVVFVRAGVNHYVHRVFACPIHQDNMFIIAKDIVGAYDDDII